MSELYDKVRPEVLVAAMKDGRLHPHEGRAVARELTELRAGGESSDAKRWQWMLKNYARLQFEFSEDTPRITKVSRIDLMPRPYCNLDMDSFVNAIDVAMREHP